MTADVCSVASRRSRSTRASTIFWTWNLYSLQLGIGIGGVGAGSVLKARHPDVSSVASRSIDTTAASQNVFRRRAGSVARAGGILQNLNLILEPCDLVRLLRLLQRVGVFVAGFLDLAELAIGVAQMLGDGGIAAGQVDGFLQLLDGFFVVALMIVNQAEAVDVKSVFGLDIERALDQLFGLDQVGALLGVTVAEVVQRLRVGGIQLDRLLHLDHTLVALLVLIERGAEREVVLVILGVGRDHLAREGNRRRVVLLFLVNADHEADDFRVVGLLGERVLQRAQRLVVFVLLVVEIGELEARLNVMLIVAGNLVELADRLVILGQLGVDRAEIIMDAVVVRLGAEHEVELGGGVVEISLLDVKQANLGAGVGGIGLDLLGAFELVQRLIVFLLAGQNFRFALAHQLVVRIYLRDLVVVDQRILRTLLPLAQQREIKQHQLRLRIEIERLLIIFFGRRVVLRGDLHFAGVVVAEERIGIERDQLI